MQLALELSFSSNDVGLPSQNKKRFPSNTWKGNLYIDLIFEAICHNIGYLKLKWLISKNTMKRWTLPWT